MMLERMPWWFVSMSAVSDAVGNLDNVSSFGEPVHIDKNDKVHFLKKKNR